MPSPYYSRLSSFAEKALQELSRKHEARESALRISREMTRLSANAIRAVHRLEFSEAKVLLDRANELLKQSTQGMQEHPDIYYAGYLADARKEFGEACITLAFISGAAIPQPEEIGIELSAYLNGMAEAAGELRRFILDSLRRNSADRCEELLEVMDEIYSLLVSIDFPEAITGGLRHTTDMVRGVLERTRGDLTMALRQRELEKTLASWENKIGDSRLS